MAKLEGYNFPDDLLYHKEHAWVRLEDDGTATIGMNEFALEAAGEVMYVDLPAEGDELKVGETCAKIQTAKWIGKLVCPLTGEVVEVNDDISFESELMNQSPYEKGWLIKLKPTNLDAEKGELMKTDEPRMLEWLKEEIERAEREKSGE